MTALLIVGNSAVSGEKAGTRTVEAIGAAIGLAAAGYVLTHPVPPPLRAVEFGLAIGVPALLVYGGHRLGAGDLRPTEQRRIAVWTAIGAAFGGVFGLSMLLHQRLVGGAIVDPGYVLLMLAAAGTLLGLLSSAATCAAGRSRPLDSEERSIVVEGLDPTAPYDVSLNDELTRRWLVETVIEDADRQRLLVLEHLYRHPYAVFSVDDLADHLLESEATDGNAVSRALRRSQFHIQLRHIDLPRLADAGLISYRPPVVQYVPEDGRD